VANAQFLLLFQLQKQEKNHLLPNVEVPESEAKVKPSSASDENPCDPLPKPPILKFRVGPYPEPVVGKPKVGRRMKKLKFAWKVELRYYECDLTNAKKYSDYYH